MAHQTALQEEHTVPTPRQELIRERIATGRTQREAALAIGISRNAIRNAEDGERVKLATAQTLAAYYGRELAELFPEVDGRLTLDVPAHVPSELPEESA